MLRVRCGRQDRAQAGWERESDACVLAALLLRHVLPTRRAPSRGRRGRRCAAQVDAPRGQEGQARGAVLQRCRLPRCAGDAALLGPRGAAAGVDFHRRSCRAGPGSRRVRSCAVLLRLLLVLPREPQTARPPDQRRAGRQSAQDRWRGRQASRQHRWFGESGRLDRCSSCRPARTGCRAKVAAAGPADDAAPAGRIGVRGRGGGASRLRGLLPWRSQER
mmetsp:Transcript_2717/g.10937  ORF Transcript_2717/g.10937 Transcript_2717/m.10937 type:complete len:219 (-) Transcript_2717:2093-2749(-)